MIKHNKFKIIFSSIITLLPMIFGVFMWKKLPESMGTHFAQSGEADAFGNKAFAVFGLPLIMLAVFLLCVFLILRDKKQAEQNRKVLNLIFIIIPAVSLLTNAIIYASALDIKVNVTFIVTLFLGFLFFFIGNYLPKTKQNSTIGIKLPWTLKSSRNWSKTHHFAGKIWVFCGALIILSSLLPEKFSLIALLSLIAIAVLVPTIYSYCISKKQ